MFCAKKMLGFVVLFCFFLIDFSRSPAGLHDHVLVALQVVPLLEVEQVALNVSVCVVPGDKEPHRYARDQQRADEGDCPGYPQVLPGSLVRQPVPEGVGNDDEGNDVGDEDENLRRAK